MLAGNAVNDGEGGGVPVLPRTGVLSAGLLLPLGNWTLPLNLPLLLLFFLGGGCWCGIILFCLHCTQVSWYKRLAGANMSRLH